MTKMKSCQKFYEKNNSQCVCDEAVTVSNSYQEHEAVLKIITHYLNTLYSNSLNEILISDNINQSLNKIFNSEEIN